MLEAFDVTSDEFTELIALYVLFPDVAERMDIGLAQVTAAVMNTRLSGGRSYEPREFVPQWGRTRVSMEDDDVLDMFRLIQEKTSGG